MSTRALRAFPYVAFIALAAAGCGVQQAPGPGSASAAAKVSASVRPVATVTLSSLPTAHPTPSPTVTATGQITLTAASNGSTVVVGQGQTIVVDLVGHSVLFYRPPRSTGPALQLVSASGGYPSTRPAVATFLATAPGTAELTSVTDAKCLHATPMCTVAQGSWRATVIVR